ncbi:MAG: hypothetical protein Q9160_008377 [Pyrenula sp. 1 TL-2023]
MPEEGVPLSPKLTQLTSPEIVHLAELFVRQGVNKIRLTGGEPTVRKDIVQLMREIGNLRTKGLKELCITTNGVALHRKLDAMAESGLTGVNLSLDTLDPFQFQIMTRRSGHELVMRSVNRILEMNDLGANIKLKINCVVMRGINDREILDFVELGREKNIETRFIEYMPFDGNKWSQGKMVSYNEMLDVIRAKYPSLHPVQGHPNDTSKTYKIPGFVGKLGFITSMTENFCGTCNRLRITSDGNLKVCLFGNAEVSLRDVIRQSNNGEPIDEAALRNLEHPKQGDGETARTALGASYPSLSTLDDSLLNVIGEAVKRKKARHAGMGELENMKNRPMILIGEPINLESLKLGAKEAVARTARFPMANKFPFSWSSLLRAPQGQDHYHLRPYTTSALSFRQPSGSSHWPKKDGVALTSRIMPASSKLTHLTSAGTAHMVAIGEKQDTKRAATAVSRVSFSNAETYDAIATSALSKGDALAVARVAGIMAAKRCSDLIALAHSGLRLTGVEIDLDLVKPFGTATSNQSAEIKDRGILKNGGIEIRATVQCHGPTGVEMEALTAATVAALNIYDMCKAVDKGMLIEGTRVLSKSGGKSGDWIWDDREGNIVKK